MEATATKRPKAGAICGNGALFCRIDDAASSSRASAADGSVPI